MEDCGGRIPADSFQREALDVCVFALLTDTTVKLDHRVVNTGGMCVHSNSGHEHARSVRSQLQICFFLGVAIPVVMGDRDAIRQSGLFALIGKSDLPTILQLETAHMHRRSIWCQSLVLLKRRLQQMTTSTTMTVNVGLELRWYLA